MEGLAGFGFLIGLISFLAAIVLFVAILSIAIDCARLLRRSV
jgi:hypothetical protein